MNKIKEEGKIIREAIFSKFGLEFMAYILIMALGVFVNAFVQGYVDNTITVIAIGIVTTILVYSMLYFLGFVSAKRKTGIKKYITPFCIFVIFGVISIIANILVLFSLDTGVGLAFVYANNLFVNSNEMILSYLTSFFGYITGYIGMILSIFVMILGVRKNVKINGKEV